MGSEMGPLSSPDRTSYRLPIVTNLNYRSISHRFRSSPYIPDRRTDGIGLANGGNML